MIYFLILGATILRLLPHPPNFAPIAALAIFGGCYLPKKQALVIPLLAMFISDIFLGFHSTMFFVYGSFILIGFLGLWLKKHKNITSVVGVTFLGSIIFFILTNLGVWLLGWYPRTIEGLITCYTMAIPFFKNTLAGDFFYVGVMFGLAELVFWLVRNKKLASVKLKK